MKWRDHVYKKEIEILTTQLGFSAKILCFSKFTHSIEASGYEPSQFPPFTYLACSFQLYKESDWMHNVEMHYFQN